MIKSHNEIVEELFGGDALRSKKFENKIKKAFQARDAEVREMVGAISYEADPIEDGTEYNRGVEDACKRILTQLNNNK